MLFKKEYNDFNNKYDFDQIPDESYGFKDLAKVIKQNIDILYGLIEDGKTIFPFSCVGSTDKEIPVRNDARFKVRKKVKLWDRDENLILEILNNDRRKRNSKNSTIESHLNKIGVLKPAEGTEDFNEYLQLIYFLYMTQYIVFPNINVYNLLEENTTDSNIGEYSEKGDCMTFILANLLENQKCVKSFINIHTIVSNYLTQIDDSLKLLYTWNNYPIVNEMNERIYENNKKLSNEKLDSSMNCKTHETILEKYMFYIYRFSFISLSNDMINNLRGENLNFHCSELELEDDDFYYSFAKQADREFLLIGEMYDNTVVDDYISSPVVISYCLQKRELNAKDKSDFTKSKSVQFVHRFISEEIDYLNNGVASAYVAYDGKHYSIKKAYILALIMAYRELNFKVQMKYYDGSQNRKSKPLRGHLINTNLDWPINMAAKELFNICFHSEYYNITRGYGYYGLFQMIDLERYMVFFEMMKIAFSSTNHDSWVELLKKLDQFLKKSEWEKLVNFDAQ